MCHITSLLSHLFFSFFSFFLSTLFTTHDFLRKITTTHCEEKFKLTMLPFIEKVHFENPIFYAKLAIIPGLVGVTLFLLYLITHCCASCSKKNQFITTNQLRKNGTMYVYYQHSTLTSLLLTWNSYYISMYIVTLYLYSPSLAHSPQARILLPCRRRVCGNAQCYQ